MKYNEEHDFQAPEKHDIFGVELQMDLHNCDILKFNRIHLKEYIDEVIKMTKMVACDIHWWGYEGDPEGFKHDMEHNPFLVGESVCQFIKTSNIVIHSILVYHKCYINIFTCKRFEPQPVIDYTKEFFDCNIAAQHFVERL
jgi:S-adenosylmethionine/arginine decarboxylase-like enzyme